MVHNNIFKIYYDYTWRKEIAQKKKKNGGDDTWFSIQ